MSIIRFIYLKRGMREQLLLRDGQISIKACPRRLISWSKMEYSQQVQGQNLITGRRVGPTGLVDAGLPSCKAQWK